MKVKVFIALFVLSLCLNMSSCVVTSHYHGHPHKEIPPGKAKKIRGDKSAKYYAPGHHKHKQKDKH